MADGRIVAICISPAKGEPMREVRQVRAIEGMGLEGDRYALGEGSFNQGQIGRRQVTLINGVFFPGSGFEFVDSRRNLVTVGVELMWLIGREFDVGEARLRGVKYCDPCKRPSRLLGKTVSFDHVFHDRGGLVAEVVRGGLIRVDDAIVPPPKGY